ncbi:SagB/ThcOx family dehydrogenase [Geobacter grbiciae]|uniref:SagB/ThcOx family dehydrogenase n=1 Tax=Geobacter grbiciae TaxID=155042 RepID=UPI001C0272F4|nr:SagB/ThcOx family dehydrogenase [Geobacter grbiciae]MBT1075122.1 SagB/ThcOx family dehydrogenase [Geobacter grbiciae]
MTNVSRMVAGGALCLFLAIPLATFADGAKVTQLEPPRKEGGVPLMDALRERKSVREFSGEALSPRQLSDLLWAAFGINRPEKGGRTAPSAMNRQEIDVYVAAADGLYLYDARGHRLIQEGARDIRALTGRQPFVAEAPVNLIYVADYGQMGEAPLEEKAFYAAADAGAISQNVYLFCASEGLATVVRASFDPPALAKAMGLRNEQRIVLAQSVGVPKVKAGVTKPSKHLTPPEQIWSTPARLADPPTSGAPEDAVTLPKKASEHPRNPLGQPKLTIEKPTEY